MVDTLPRDDIYLYESGFEDEGGQLVEFHLIYRGRLPSAGRNNTRVDDKQRIRLEFHKQLKVLWNDHRALRGFETQPIPLAGGAIRTMADIWADRYDRCSMRFLPLVSNYLGLACSLDILFLRRDNPGGFIVSGGDIDNRLKVLFDALRMPENCEQIPKGWAPSEDERPLYCLLEDDSLIHKVTVRTDALLLPLQEGESQNDVVLIVHVATKIVNHDVAHVELG